MVVIGPVAFPLPDGFIVSVCMCGVVLNKHIIRTCNNMEIYTPLFSYNIEMHILQYAKDR